MKVDIYSIGVLDIRWKYIRTQKERPPIAASCVISLANNVLSYGHSTISKNDNWCYDKGRKVSLTRALKMLGVGKKERTLVWNNYFEMTSTVHKSLSKTSVQAA